VTTFILLFALLFVSVLLWRTVFVRQKERQVIRFGLREFVIAAGIAAVIAGGLFYLLFNTTLRIV
jgi:membrane protein implicated in regulation of membrane protease activity